MQIIITIASKDRKWAEEMAATIRTFFETFDVGVSVEIKED